HGRGPGAGRGVQRGRRRGGAPGGGRRPGRRRPPGRGPLNRRAGARSGPTLGDGARTTTRPMAVPAGRRRPAPSRRGTATRRCGEAKDQAVAQVTTFTTNVKNKLSEAESTINRSISEGVAHPGRSVGGRTAPE